MMCHCAFIIFQIESVLKWNDNHKNHFRLKARYLLERLIRKFRSHQNLWLSTHSWWFIHVFSCLVLKWLLVLYLKSTNGWWSILGRCRRDIKEREKTNGKEELRYVCVEGGGVIIETAPHRSLSFDLISNTHTHVPDGYLYLHTWTIESLS